MAFDLLPVPDSVKILLPYIQRSIELEKKAPIVAYYCRSYAAQRGVQELQREDHPRDKASETYLFGLMDFLEEEKVRLNPDPEDGKATVQTLAVKIFKKADEAEKRGVLNQKTAKLFYVSSILFETATQFGELEENLAQLYQYGRYKAAEVKKTLKNGDEETTDDLAQLKQELNQPLPQQTPQPQQTFEQQPEPMQQDDDFEKLQQKFLYQSQQFDNPSNTSSFDSNFQQPPQQQPQQQQQYQPPQQQEQPQQQYQPPPPQQQQYQPPPQQQKSPRNKDPTFGGYKDDYIPPSTGVTQENIDQATKFAKYAISSLSFDDVEAARQNLKKAHQSLGA